MPRKRIQMKEAADLLGCSPRMALKLVAAGEISAARVGRIWTTTEAHVMQYLARNENTRCPPISTRGPDRPTGGRVSKSTAATSVEAYERAIGLRPSVGSGPSSKKPRPSARA